MHLVQETAAGLLAKNHRIYYNELMDLIHTKEQLELREDKEMMNMEAAETVKEKKKKSTHPLERVKIVYDKWIQSVEDIGEAMKKYAEQNNLMSQPRRSLIGSYHGKKILLATPLLQWYISHGLVVTKIYQVVQYWPKDCFKKFGEEVSEARCNGDADPEQAIIADTMKLLGNSAYGKTITNKDRH